MLCSERNGWKEILERGDDLYINTLKEYKENRDSEQWRLSRTVEMLCEYVLYLEKKSGISQVREEVMF